MVMEAMFSTTPSTRTPTFVQKLSSFRTSAIDTSSLVVTTMDEGRVLVAGARRRVHHEVV